MTVTSHGQPFWLAVISTARPDSYRDLEPVVGPHLEHATFYVRPGEEDAYRRYGARHVVEVEGLSNARNRALQDAFAHWIPCVQLSDDLTRIVHVVRRDDWTEELPRYLREESVFDRVVRDLYYATEAFDCLLAGVAPTDSLLHYKGTDLHQSGFILGDFMLIRPNPLRFDPELSLKEDYDYTAQHLAEYGRVCRRECWLLSFRHRNNAGGAVLRRTDELEQASISYLQSKWGANVMRRRPSKPNEISLRWPSNRAEPYRSTGAAAG